MVGERFAVWLSGVARKLQHIVVTLLGSKAFLAALNDCPHFSGRELTGIDNTCHLFLHGVLCRSCSRFCTTQAVPTQCDSTRHALVHEPPANPQVGRLEYAIPDSCTAKARR